MDHHQSFIAPLKNSLTNPLPGKAAHDKMAHTIRKHYPTTPENAKIACVMILLYQKQAKWHLVLIQRMSTHKQDKHSGQISFPGGQREAQDFNLEQCALRETEEEIGINRHSIEVLGQLTELYIPVSNFLVHPFVGYLPTEAQFSLQATEVRDIIEVPLSLLQQKETIQTTEIRISQNILLKHVPYFNLDQQVVWGATAMILSEFLDLLVDPSSEI